MTGESPRTQGRRWLVVLSVGAGLSACGGGGGGPEPTGTSSVSSTTAPPVPTVTLAASPTPLMAGDDATLTWSSANATACTAGGAWSGSEATSGTQQISPAATGVFTYTLTCSGAGGSATASAAVTVSAAAQGTASVMPATLTFASQTIGTTSTAQGVTLSNTGTGVLSGIALTVTGDFAKSSTCGASLAPASRCTINLTFTPAATGTLTGMLSIASSAAGGSVSVPLSGTGTSPPAASGALPLLSVGLPIFASSGSSPAADANSGNYNLQWRSTGVPVTLSVDLSSVPAAERQSIWLIWYNDATYGYDHSLIGQPGYDNPGAYSLAVNAARGGTSPPTAGWVQVAGLANNTLHSYSHDISFAGYNWIQYTFNAADGSPLNMDIALDLDIYGTSNGVTDGWFFGGDSITANCMQHDNVYAQDENHPSTNITLAAPSFGQQVNALIGNDTPAQENGGMPGYTAGDMIPDLAGWLENVPSKYVTLNFGTNDAVSTTAAGYYTAMASLVQAVIAAGKRPIVPTIPYSLDSAHEAAIPTLNAQLAALYTAYPAIVPGPDFYTYFRDNPQYLSTDNVHPNAQGCVAYRSLWARFAAATIYGK